MTRGTLDRIGEQIKAANANEHGVDQANARAMEQANASGVDQEAAFGRDADGFPLDIPFLGFVGLRALEIADGRAVLVLEEQQRHHQNSFDMAHGGVVMTMLDVAMAMAGRSLARADQGEATGMITIEMKATFMQPARGALRAEGRCIHRTASMAFCEADLFDFEGRLAARSSGTFKYARHRKTKP